MEKLVKQQHIKTFSDNSILSFTRGKFDDWCVVYSNGEKSKAPGDIDYLFTLQQLGKLHGRHFLYNDFCVIYDRTDMFLSLDVLHLINILAKKYTSDSLTVDKIYTTLYATMVAEQNKAFTKLGKRIKRLAVYQILVKYMDAQAVSNFSRGKTAQELDALCSEYGF